MKYDNKIRSTKRSKKDYVIVDAYEAQMLDFLEHEPPDKMKSFIRNLNGMGRILYNKKVKVKRINPKDDPEYYI